MEPGTDPIDAVDDDTPSIDLPERARAIRAGLLGLGLGVILAILGRDRPRG
jgi:hypothetical protein